MGLKTKVQSNGHDLLDSFQAVVEQHRQDAEFRNAAVSSRIAELEAELLSLRTLQTRLSAASA